MKDFRPTVRESLREALVVVGSILVAFALDAWWDNRVELRQAGEIVASLEAELSANRERLRGDIETVETYVTAAQRLLEAASVDPAERPAAASMGADLWETLSWRTSNLTTATLDAAISAGRLESIEPAPLRVALAGWPAVIDDMVEEEEFEWREITERYHPFLAGALVIPSLQTDEPLPTPDAETLDRLLDDVEFRSRLAWRLDVSMVALEAKADALNEIARILELLRRAP